MDTAYAFDARLELLKVMLVGRVEAAPLLAVITTLRRLAAQLRPVRVVYDCSAVMSIHFDTSFVDSLASLRPVFDSGAQEVILAPQEYLYGLARMFQQMSEQQQRNVKVVRTWPEAHHVFGLTEPPRYSEVPVA